MAYFLDYSKDKLSAQTILNAGYSGVIRYIDSPDRLGTKHTSKAEYDDHIRNGLTVYLVFEYDQSDPLGGFAAGQANARRALAGADMLGYKGVIFFCCDRWMAGDPSKGIPTIPVSAWQAYLDGAASVIGKDRLGAYGFWDAMDAGYGHASYYWQCGARSVLRPFVHVWQDNNVQPYVGGMQTDRNEILKQINVYVSGKEDIMSIGIVPNSLPASTDWQFVSFPFEGPANGVTINNGWFVVSSSFGSIEYQTFFGAGGKVVHPKSGWPEVGKIVDCTRAVFELPDFIDTIGFKYRSLNLEARAGYAFVYKTK